MDHLGRNIRIPTEFCSTWKVDINIVCPRPRVSSHVSCQGFNNIINGFCKDRAGSSFIERGDYKLIRPEDSQVIDPSEFLGTVVSGMVLEMSVIMRQESSCGNSKDKCPRCHHINLNLVGNGGWIEWKVALDFYAR